MIDITPQARGHLCDTLYSAYKHGAERLSAVPGLIRKVIETRAWESRIGPNGKVIQLAGLRDLIEKKPPEGWYEKCESLEALIREDPEVLTLWREALVGNHGGDRKSEGAQIKSNNVTLDGLKRGNARSYTLDRLKRERSDLYERVVSKELSANAAAIEAGWRQRMIQVPDDLEKACDKLSKHFGTPIGKL